MPPCLPPKPKNQSFTTRRGRPPFPRPAFYIDYPAGEQVNRPPPPTDGLEGGFTPLPTPCTSEAHWYRAASPPNPQHQTGYESGAPPPSSVLHHALRFGAGLPPSDPRTPQRKSLEALPIQEATQEPGVFTSLSTCLGSRLRNPVAPWGPASRCSVFRTSLMQG